VADAGGIGMIWTFSGTVRVSGHGRWVAVDVDVVPVKLSWENDFLCKPIAVILAPILLTYRFVCCLRVYRNRTCVWCLGLTRLHGYTDALWS